MFNALELGTAEKLSPWRKISMGSWRPNGASSILVKETIDLTFYDELKVKYREKGKGISFNSYLAYALGNALKENPRANSIIKMGKIYPRKNVEMFFHVLRNETEDDLSGVKIHYDQGVGPTSLEEQFSEKIAQCKKNDPEFKKIKGLYKFIPSTLSKLFLDVTSFFLYSLNLNLSMFGVPKDSFGSIMVTNVATFGFQMAFTPIAPYTRIPIVIAVGTPEKRCVVKSDQMVVARQVDLGMHFDHRLVDGIQIAGLLKSLRKYLVDPKLMEMEL